MSDKIVDKRIVSHQLRRKILTQKEYQKQLDELEDCSELSVEVETRFIRKVQSEKESDS